ncbi:MAG: TonB-dependent receptor family protein [Prevotellaceae bacterium]|jgi:hypothetical protein|nr:TonB-dependent receptor family protein [Prevotellaceae bacterium]
MKLIVLFIVFVTDTCCLSAQNISGKVANQNEEPLRQASIVLKSFENDVIGSVKTDANGAFTLLYENNGDYLLEIFCAGYDSVFIQLKNSVGDINLGIIKLSEQVVLLDQVVVQATQKNVKIDRQIIFPTEVQVKTSSSGYGLLNKITLPGIKTDDMQNTVASIGNAGTVQIRINGIEASQSEIIALNPKNVLRIEFIDAPGVRYGENVGSVINFIVKQPDGGITAGVNLTGALTANYGSDNIYLRINHKKSEFGLSYGLDYSDFSQREDEEIRYRMPDQTVHQINRKGTDSPIFTGNHKVQIKYNLHEADKYVFNVSWQNNFRNNPANISQNVSETDENDYRITREINDKSSSMALDLYFQTNLPKSQNLIFNLTGACLNSDYEYSYQSYNQDSNLSKHGYSADGEKYSLIGEALYEKQWKDLKYSGGLHVTQNYLNNIYTDTQGTSDAKMHNTSLYFYSQIRGKFHKFGYMLGLGFSSQRNEQNSDRYTYLSFRPVVNLSYPVFKNAVLRYGFSVRPHLPSLSNLSDVRLQKNDWEITVGNSHLKPFRNIINDLIFDYQHSKFSVQITTGYRYSKNAVMPTIERIQAVDGNVLFLFGGENQKSMSHLRGQVDVQYDIIPDKLIFEGYGGIIRSFSDGNNYTHALTSVYGGGQLLCYVGRWSVAGSVNSRYREFFGETVWNDACYSRIRLSYHLKNMHFSAGWMYPLQSKGKYSGTELNSQLMQKTAWTAVKNYGNMLTLNFVWNLNLKRKYQIPDKRLNNTDNDAGIVK